jgi:MoxR-like ATPase
MLIKQGAPRVTQHAATPNDAPPTPEEIAGFAQFAHRLAGAIGTVVLGKPELIRLALTALLAEGHLLVEDVPGVGKTTLARSMAAVVQGAWRRIQFTPDLLPSDVTGVTIFNQGTRSFEFHPGPVFANIVIADEINRASPKTQSALLEVMEEGRVTVDGATRDVGRPFMVIATQNPIEQQGTYPLPEAQLDRFLFKIVIEHPSRDEERAIVRQHGHRSAMPRLEEFGLEAVADATTLASAREAVTKVRLSDELVDYIVDVIRSTREHSSLEVGASTRAANMLAAGVRAYAVLQGRDFVIPDDVKALALPVLRHRLTMSPGAEIEGLSTDRILRDILDQTPAPR